MEHHIINKGEKSRLMPEKIERIIVIFNPIGVLGFNGDFLRLSIIAIWEITQL